MLDDVDLAVEAGEFVAIAGPNGGGKTTLLRLALGLERPTRGEVLPLRRAGATLLATARASATSPSARSSGSHAPATVREVVAAGRAPLRACSAACARDDREAVDEAIERVGLAELARRGR